jgi:plasmid stabilization system protein ParE
MKRTIVWMPRAIREAGRASAWWARNRDKAPDLLDRELAGALEMLRTAPEGGVPHGEGLRRIHLPKTRYVVIYAYDPKTGVVEILSFWSSLRRRTPRLR